jgi:hypothetical protein
MGAYHLHIESDIAIDTFGGRSVVNRVISRTLALAAGVMRSPLTASVAVGIGGWCGRTHGVLGQLRFRWRAFVSRGILLF